MNTEPQNQIPQPTAAAANATSTQSPHPPPVSDGLVEGRPPRRAWPMAWRVVALTFTAAVAIVAWRATTAQAAAREGATNAPVMPPAARSVSVARVSRVDLHNEVPISAEFRPYLEVELHAKVSGYVEEMRVDFGDRVKAGDLLARLEVPELSDELDRAIAAEKRARADHKAAHFAYDALVKVEKAHPNLVSQEELETAEAKDLTTDAAIAGARADVERYQTLVGYTRITAPFDGVITRRYADPGALIQSGTASSTQSLPLVRLSDNYRLRLDIPVTVKYVKDIRVGDTVEVRVQSLGGKILKGTICRFTDKVDAETRTMIVEVEVPNPNLELIPGMYAKVVLNIQQRSQVLAVPTESIDIPKADKASESSDTPKKGTVYVVNSKQEIEERSVTLGVETPTQYEVTAGLKEGDLVLTSSRSVVTPGQKVEVKPGFLAQK